MNGVGKEGGFFLIECFCFNLILIILDIGVNRILDDIVFVIVRVLFSNKVFYILKVR